MSTSGKQAAPVEGPSLVRRATNLIIQYLELDSNRPSYVYHNAPPKPSNWSDSTHRQTLLRMWDKLCENAKTVADVPALMVRAQQAMMKAFPELDRGDETLSLDWVEYILALSLRPGFRQPERMGRWDTLAAGASTRGTWGPW